MPFQCDLCNSCCLAIGKLVVGSIAAMDEAERTGEEIHPILQEISEFPYDINEDGSCSQLGNGFCKIYPTRPLICRTDEMYEKYWSKIMTREQWYAESKKSCQKLREAHHGPLSNK